mgnify:CR=1 FL=1
MNIRLDLLIICDEHLDANTVGTGLANAGYLASIRWVSDELTLRGALAERDYDLVICDDKTEHVDTVTARSLIADPGPRHPVHCNFQRHDTGSPENRLANEGWCR